MAGRNGSGVFTVTNPDFVSGTTISSSEMDANFSDVATAITQSIAVDGQTTITANLPMSGYKHTGVAAGTALTEYADVKSVQNGTYIWCGTAGGTADAITLTPSPAITAYVTGQKFRWKAGSSANTGAATVAISGLSAKALEIDDAALTSAGEHEANKYFEGLYDGTAFQITRLSAAAGLSASLTRGYAIAGNSSGVAAAVDISTDGNALVGDGTDAVATGIIKQGTHTIWVPAGAMRPTVSNGCATLTDVETTAGRPDITVLDFDASSDEHAQFSVSFPKSWNEGTVTFQVFWTSTATDTDGVTWALQGVAVSDGDTIDVAYGTAVTVDDANQSTAEDLYASAVSGAVTIAGTPAAGDLCYFRVFRDVSDANDTAAEDARLIGVKIFYTVNAADDS